MYPNIAQPSAFWLPGTTTTAPGGDPHGWGFTGTGTITNPTPATTNVQTQACRTEWSNAAAAVGGIVSNSAVVWRGNANRQGGFYFSARFSMPTNAATVRAFVGLSQSNTHVCASGEPSTINNTIGMGFDSTDVGGNWYLIGRDGSTTSKTSLSAAPRNAIDVYDLVIFAKPNSAALSVRILNLSTGAVAFSGDAAIAPQNTTLLFAHVGVRAAVAGSRIALYQMNVNPADDGAFSPDPAQPVLHLASATAAGAAGSAVRVASSGTGQIEVTSVPLTLRTRPFLGVALQAWTATGHPVAVQTAGTLDPAIKSLGAGVACAVGVTASGTLVRATDTTCVSAPNWIGDCNAAGTITIAPRRSAHLDVIDFGATGDGTTDDTDALQAALSCTTRIVPSAGPTYDKWDGSEVHLPAGVYRITKPLVVSRGMHVSGAADSSGTGTTKILVDTVNGNFNMTTRTGMAAVGGATVYCAVAFVGNAPGLTASPVLGDAARTVFENIMLSNSQFTIIAPPTGNASMDGMRIMTVVSIRNAWIDGFPRDGVHLHAPATPAPAVNVDQTQLVNVFSSNNGRHGIFCSGDDSNVIHGMGLSLVSNWDSGLYDNSFFGNTWVACHAASNRKYNYYYDRNSGGSTFVGCYAEGDARSLIRGDAVVEGGWIANLDVRSRFHGFDPVNRSHRYQYMVNRAGDVQPYPGNYNPEVCGRYVDLGETFLMPGGYRYVALNAGRTASQPNGDPAPGAWPNVLNATLVDGQITWKCIDSVPYQRFFARPHLQFGDAVDMVDLHGYVHEQSSKAAQWIRSVSDGPYTRGRLGTTMVATGLLGRAAGWETGPGCIPAPGQRMLPSLWYGSEVYEERRIDAAYNGSPQAAGTYGSGRFAFYRPGDIVFNSTESGGIRSGPVGWAVRKRCGISSTGALNWSASTHYEPGDVVLPSTGANGFVYRMVGYSAGAPSWPGDRVSNTVAPTWTTTFNATITDNHLTWQAMYDAQAPANADVMEAIPGQAAAQANSAATDVAGLRADFNALLAKLRTSSALAT